VIEAFGCDVTTSDGRGVNLHFEESDPLREKPGQPWTDGLVDRIRPEQ
jgi:hypothetical protein